MVKPEREKQQAAETSSSGSGSGSGSSESKYKGVRKRKWGKWVSEIRLPNSRERIWLGSYDSAEKAARAFDAALFCLRSSSAKFNFPDNPPDIAGGRTLAPHEIQAAAQRFANSESPIVNPRHSSSCSSLPSCSSSCSSCSSVMRVDFPTPSVLDGPAQLDTGSGLHGSDLFAPIGSDNFMTGSYEMFQGFDDFICNDYFMPPLPNFDYPEENYDGSYSQDPFL